MDRLGLHTPGLRSPLNPFHYAPRIPPMLTNCASEQISLCKSPVDRNINHCIREGGIAFVDELFQFRVVIRLAVYRGGQQTEQRQNGKGGKTSFHLE